jgi:hypothetical protein
MPSISGKLIRIWRSNTQTKTRKSKTISRVNRFLRSPSLLRTNLKL